MGLVALRQRFDLAGHGTLIAAASDSRHHLGQQSTRNLGLSVPTDVPTDEMSDMERLCAPSSTSRRRPIVDNTKEVLLTAPRSTLPCRINRGHNVLVRPLISLCIFVIFALYLQTNVQIVL